MRQELYYNLILTKYFNRNKTTLLIIVIYYLHYSLTEIRPAFGNTIQFRFINRHIS